MSEQERKPILLGILRVPGLILLLMSRLIGRETAWAIFRAIAHVGAWLFGYKVEDPSGHAMGISFSKRPKT